MGFLGGKLAPSKFESHQSYKIFVTSFFINATMVLLLFRASLSAQFTVNLVKTPFNDLVSLSKSNYMQVSQFINDTFLIVDLFWLKILLTLNYVDYILVNMVASFTECYKRKCLTKFGKTMFTLNFHLTKLLQKVWKLPCRLHTLVISLHLM